MGIAHASFRTEEVQGGVLACAKVVSTILKEAGILTDITISVDKTVEALKNQGWKYSDKPVIGGVVIWDRTKDFPNKHIGIVIGGNQAVNNSSYLKMPVITSIYDEKREVLFFLYPGASDLDSSVERTLSLRDTKKSLGEWRLTRYYSPLPDQKKYYYKAGYSKDKEINCGPGSCLDTSDGTHLNDDMAFKVAACPKNYPSGTKFYIETIGEVVCHDVGGAIKGKRLDIWAGIGDQGIKNMADRPETGGLHEVYLIGE